jgi:hypothetical protein
MNSIEIVIVETIAYRISLRGKKSILKSKLENTERNGKHIDCPLQ